MAWTNTPSSRAASHSAMASSGVTHDQRHDRHVADLDAQSLPQHPRVRVQAAPPVPVHQVERLQRRPDRGRRKRGRVDQRPRAVDQVVGDLARAAHERPVGAQRLPQRADGDDVLLQTRAHARARGPRGPITPVACASSTITRAPVSTSARRSATSPSMREDGVGDDHVGALRDLAVRVDQRLRPREPAAVDDRRVVERVARDHAVGRQRRDHARVGEEAGAEQDARLGALELREPLLELAVDAPCGR